MRPLPSRGLLLAALLAATFALDLGGLWAPAAGDSLALLPEALPSARHGVSAVWTGQATHVFGGHDGGYLAQIVRHNPATGAVTVLAAALPTARAWTTAVWTGTHAYVFGGNGGAHLDDIVRFDPASGAVTTMQASLPTASSFLSAVWTGEVAYLFGGSNGVEAWLDQIVRYDPALDEATLLEAKLPTGRDFTAAVWDGRYAYVFGGTGPSSGQYRDDIVRFDPVSETVEVLTPKLPPMGRLSAAWDGTQAYLFGGRNATADLDSIVRFDPAALTVQTQALRLASPRGAGAAVWTGSAAYYYGGERTLPSTLSYDDVFRYDPQGLPAPVDVAAFAGPGDGQVTVSWAVTPHAVLDGVDAHRVYRRTAGGPEQAVANVSMPGTNLTDSGLAPLRTHYYRVTSLRGAMESPSSLIACSAAQPWHLLPSLDPPCAAPPGWQEVVLLDATTPLPLLPALLGPVVVDVRQDPDDPRYLRVEVQPGYVEVPVLRVYTAGAAPAQPVHVELPATVLPADAARVFVAYRYDPTAPLCLLFVGPRCQAQLPFEPPDAAFLLGRGAASEVVVHVQLLNEGAVVAEPSLRVPIVGQAGAALPFGP